MNCQNTTETITSCTSCGSDNNNGFLIIVVLYILLAIILGSRCRNY